MFEPGDTATHNGRTVVLGTFPGSAGYRHQCGDLGCRRFDVHYQDGEAGEHYVWECKLTPATCVSTVASQAFPHVGSRLAWTAPDGRTTISVIRGHAAWTVETYQGTYRMDDQCGSYATEEEARLVARAYAVLAKRESGASETVSEAPSVVRVQPAAPRTWKQATDQQAELMAAIGTGGYIRRGAGPGRASVTQLTAMARRGLVELDVELVGARKIVVGATIR